MKAAIKWKFNSSWPSPVTQSANAFRLISRQNFFHSASFIPISNGIASLILFFAAAAQINSNPVLVVSFTRAWEVYDPR